MRVEAAPIRPVINDTIDRQVRAALMLRRARHRDGIVQSWITPGVSGAKLRAEPVENTVAVPVVDVLRLEDLARQVRVGHERGHRAILDGIIQPFNLHNATLLHDLHQILAGDQMQAYVHHQRLRRRLDVGGRRLLASTLARAHPPAVHGLEHPQLVREETTGNDQLHELFWEFIETRVVEHFVRMVADKRNGVLLDPVLLERERRGGQAADVNGRYVGADVFLAEPNERAQEVLVFGRWGGREELRE